MKKIKNELNNIIFEGIYYLVNILINLVTRKMIINYVGMEIVALNDLLNQIVNFFTLIEFGICNIMLFNLYGAIKEDNKKKISNIMFIFKHIYFKISIYIIVIGLLVIPFLNIFVNDYNGVISYIFIYLLILFQNAFIFLLSYKIYLLQAYQKTYLYLRIMILYKLLSFFLEVILLLIFNNYYIYFIFYTINNIFVYYIISKYVEKKYNYLKQENEVIYNIDIKSHIKNTGISKICNSFNQGLNSFVISILMPISIVGMYSNYYLLVSSICCVIQKIYDSFKAKIANLITNNNLYNVYLTYRFLHELGFIVAFIISILYYIFIDNIIELWLGDEYILSNSVSLGFSVQIFILIYRINLWQFISINGWFNISKVSDLIGVIFNLIMSIVLGIYFGILGVIIAVLVSYTIQFAIELYAIHSKLKRNNIFVYIKEIFLIIFYLIIIFFIKKNAFMFISIFLIFIIIYVDYLKRSFSYVFKN